MATGFDTVSFLSDYGLADEFVGVVKAVIRAIAPDTSVIDVTHDVAPHDIRAASLVLARSIQYLPPGVVLAVVDPGVGTDRRALAVEVGGAGDQEERSVLVGPDNGLLAPAVALAGGARRAVSLTNSQWHLAAPGPTFAGRDVFAPVVAHLCAGVELDELGDPVDPFSLVPGIVPLSREEEGAVEGEVLWVDRFGNAQLNVGPDEIDFMGSPVVVRIGDRARHAARVSSFAELAPGQVGLLVDSYGLLAVTLDRRSAAEELPLAAGDLVRLEPAGD
ncbi:MAG: SAM-dependent chlorinase/fluorinase [Acidimicrobiia bacterium]|nr:SAM-dependent chlorinase/fluorinase [Acidimicrobiia bacterium]